MKRAWQTAVVSTAVGVVLLCAGLTSVSGQSEERLKADLEEARVMAATGKVETDGFKKLIEKVAPNFKPVPIAEGTSTNRFFKVTLNQLGAGFDGLRFRVSPGQDWSFIWIFASTKANPVVRWMIADADGRVPGFQSFRQSSGRNPNRDFFGHAYDVVLPWGREADDHFTILHYAQGVLKAGREYWVWVEFKDGATTQLQGAITLPPAGTQLMSPQEQEYALDLVRD